MWILLINTRRALLCACKTTLSAGSLDNPVTELNLYNHFSQKCADAGAFLTYKFSPGTHQNSYQ